MSVLLFAESSNGTFKKPTLEAASYGFQLAKSLGTNLIAVSMGNISNDHLQVLAKYGVSKVYTIAGLDTFSGPVFASAVAAVAKSTQAKAVVMSQTYSARAIAPRIAVKLDAAMFSGVSSMVTASDSGFTAERTAYSLKAVQQISSTHHTLVITLKNNAYKLEVNETTMATEAFSFAASGNDAKLKSLSIEKASSKVSLTEADTVVSAGRGLKGPENWGMIEELAELLGAATACSKPVADVHWRPHHEHVGQTGIQVSPNIYIAIGISGAIQHLAGVSASKTIIVINKDAEAPFFKIADYGIVGDAFEVVPKLIASVKNYKSKH